MQRASEDPGNPIPAEVWAAFAVEAGASVAPLGNGLINETYLVSAARGPLVLQRVNPLFAPDIHRNIEAVTEALARAGMATPRLVRTVDGQLCFVRGGGSGTGEVWRLLTHVAGESFDVVGSPAQAAAAAALVARFHRTLAPLVDGGHDFVHDFVGLRLGVHDTPRHLAALREAISTQGQHRLFGAAAPLAAALLAAAAELPPLPALPPLVGHGDLKIANVLFAGAGRAEREQAVCLIDLDTVGPVALAHELGDALRSWCNRNGEDRPEADLDLDVLAAAVDGYRAGLGRPLTEDERRAILVGPDWISLELSTRFAADALNERYFGWNAARFAGRGEHNLVRARSQWSLHQALVASRPRRARQLNLPE